MRKVFLPLIGAVSVAVFSAFAFAGPAGASDRAVDHAKPNHGEVSCMAIGVCPKPGPPEDCDAAGNCEEPPDEGCYEGPNGDCLPPWCDTSRPVEDCPAEPPKPPFCEDGADFCIPPMPPWCDEEGDCKPPPRPPLCDENSDPAVEPCTELPPGCKATVEGDVNSVECLPPWCDPEAAAEDCSPEPPICDENSNPADFCIPPRPPDCDEVSDPATEPCVEWPPLPPWCDDEGNCEPPICLPMLRPGACFPQECDPAETNPKFCRPFPEDPIVCVMGWPSDEPMPECPPVDEPPLCEGGEVYGGPVPMGRPNSKFRGRPDMCFEPPAPCYPADDGTTDPSDPTGDDPGAVTGEEGTTEPEDSGTGDDPTGTEEGTTPDPLPCIDPPVYGCFEDENGHTLCVDPPADCWEADDKESLIACFSQPPSDPKTTDNGEVKRNNKGKKAKVKAAKAKAKAKAAKLKKAKAKKAKAKAAKARN